MKRVGYLFLVICLIISIDTLFAQTPEQKKIQQQVEMDSLKNLIKGEWLMIQASVNGKERKKVDGFMIFLENGLFYNEDATDPLTPNGKWKMMPNKALQIIIAEEKYKNKIKEINDTALLLEMKTPDSDLILMRFKRSKEKIEIKGY